MASVLMDSKRSAATRVTVVTEGIFVARIQADPELLHRALGNVVLNALDARTLEYEKIDQLSA